MSRDTIKRLDEASAVLIALYTDTKATEIADILDMISAYREEHMEENSQFGVGA